MQLSQMMRIDFVNACLSSKRKDDVLTELLNTIIQGGIPLNIDLILDILKQRENLGSTGIGEGVAIPHGKIPALNDIIVAFGRSEEGVDYHSLDGKPVYLFFLLLAPENSAGQHLKILAKISKMLKETSFRTKLLKAESQSDLYKIIMEQEKACVA